MSLLAMKKLIYHITILYSTSAFSYPSKGRDFCSEVFYKVIFDHDIDNLNKGYLRSVSYLTAI